MQISLLASYMVFSCSWCKKFRVVSEIRCKGSAFICNLMANWKYFQLFIKNTAQSVVFLITLQNYCFRVQPNGKPRKKITINRIFL